MIGVSHGAICTLAARRDQASNQKVKKRSTIIGDAFGLIVVGEAIQVR
jgi:hypothetical protein